MPQKMTPEQREQRKRLRATLRAARALLTPKKAWTQRAMARTESGVPVAAAEDTAASYCMVGAISKVVERPNDEYEVWPVLQKFTEGLSIPTFNDLSRTTHRKVLQAFDKAIVSLGSKV